MRSSNAMAIALFLVFLVVGVSSPLAQVILVRGGVPSPGLLSEVAPSVFLYIDPEPIAYYRDGCGYVPIYHYILAPYDPLYSPYERAVFGGSREVSSPQGLPPASGAGNLLYILDDIERMMSSVNITYRGLQILNTISNPVAVVMISDRDLEKALNISGNLSAILTAHGLKLYMRAVSPETFDVDRFIEWNMDHQRALENILREYSVKLGRNLSISLGGAVGRLPIISIVYTDDKGDLSPDQITELGIQLAKAIREISGCKLFAIEYSGAIIKARTLEPIIDYRPYAFIAVVTIAILASIYIISRKHRP
ncbi:MAG: hypothetical protein QXE01_02455 [Sulfolobales archaeon]